MYQKAKDGTIIGISGALLHGQDDQRNTGESIEGIPVQKLDSGVQLNLENLTKIDEKLQ